MDCWRGEGGVSIRGEHDVEAGEVFLEVITADGSPPPVPFECPAFSGQFRVWVPVSMHESLTARARYEGISLNTLIVALLAEGLGSREVRTFRRSGVSA